MQRHLGGAPGHQTAALVLAPDGDGEAHRISNLEIHHKDRNPNNNDPRNLRILTEKEHEDLHSKYG